MSLPSDTLEVWWDL